MSGRNPFEEIERLLDTLGQELESQSLGLATGSVAVDLVDRGDAFVLTADLPGFTKDDIEVTLADRTLRIEATRETEAETTGEDGEFLRRERSRASVNRSVRLPEPVEQTGIEASYNNGVLEVTLPKATGDGGTEIDIE